MIRMANQLHYFSSRKMVRRAFYRPWTNQGKGICRMFNAISSSSTLASWQPNFPTFFASNSMCVLLMQLMLSCSLSLSLSLSLSPVLPLSLPCEQCDQIGRFWKIIGNKISSKRSGNDWHLLGYFEKPNSYEKTAFATFWATFGKNWATFYSNIWLHCFWANSFLLYPPHTPIRSRSNIHNVQSMYSIYIISM